MDDFTVENQGSVWLFTARSPEARDEMSMMGLAEWQRLGEFSFGVDHRAAGGLVEQLRENGFSVGSA